jgi:hypothetical protein
MSWNSFASSSARGVEVGHLAAAQARQVLAVRVIPQRRVGAVPAPLHPLEEPEPLGAVPPADLDLLELLVRPIEDPHRVGLLRLGPGRQELAELAVAEVLVRRVLEAEEAHLQDLVEALGQRPGLSASQRSQSMGRTLNELTLSR